MSGPDYYTTEEMASIYSETNTLSQIEIKIGTRVTHRSSFTGYGTVISESTSHRYVLVEWDNGHITDHLKSMLTPIDNESEENDDCVSIW